MARRSLWVPALLSSLALITVVGGVAVGHFYWTSLRGSLSQMQESMSQARERQHVLIDQVERTQDLLGDQERRLREEAEALAEQRRQIARDREALALATAERAAADQRELREAERRAANALRLEEAARLVALAGDAPGTDPAATAAILAAAGVLLEAVEGDAAQALGSRLQTLRERLTPPDAAGRAGLAARLDAALDGELAELSAGLADAAHAFRGDASSDAAKDAAPAEDGLPPAPPGLPSD